jgi:murein DD-endopeptidase MepM/ murein hydrolase activator NlpD
MSEGYRFTVKRGQRTEIQVSHFPAGDARLFIDLFREASVETAAENRNDALEQSPHEHVATADEGSRRLAFEPRHDGVYILRIQPELLRGGSFRVTIRNVPSLEFPVEGRDTNAIGSRFGAAREGGRRQHHGVDIFAPRHTTVRAASASRVRLVTDWRLGGRVVWLEDPARNLRLYFAHLETQDVEEGVWLRAGDPIGTVGNSGNARTTPPHLHFGVYVRGEGPIDPLPFLESPRASSAPLTIEPELLGTHFRTLRDGVALFEAPQHDRENDTHRLQLHANTPLRAIGGYGRRLHVELPDGHRGFVDVASLEAMVTPLETIRLASQQSLLDRPSRDSAPIRNIAAGKPVGVMGRFNEFLLVIAQEADSRSGWIVPVD